METIEYRHLDKTTWARGPWDDEPDKIQWMTQAGFPGLAVRGPLGAWCGYVGVSEGHPWFQKYYDGCEMADEDWWPHGGLTYADFCQETREHGICHVPGPGEPDRVWWLGFDCAHAGDLTDIMHPEVYEKIRREFPRHRENDVYRDLSYVRGEVERLAEQAAKVVNG